jgi:hypothetical protein
LGSIDLEYEHTELRFLHVNFRSSHLVSVDRDYKANSCVLRSKQ